MPQSQHLGVSGLFTDPNPHVAVPEGALETANEIDITRVGVAEPRPGFSQGTLLTSSGSGNLDDVVALHSYRGAMLAVGHVEGGSLATVLSGGYGVSTGSAHLPWFADNIRAEEARGNLYLNTSDTPRKLTAVGADQVAARVGVLPPLLLSAITAGASGWLSQDEAVSYRMVIKHTDANDVDVYSAPSGRIVLLKTSAGTSNTQVDYVWKDAPIGAELQLYRSRTAVGSGVKPDDEHFLLWSRALDTAAGVGLFIDDITADRLGRPLYIDEEVDELGREDIDASNWRPPACKDLALYAGSLFFANLRDYARVTFTRHTNTGGLGDERGLGIRILSADYTNGSAIIGGLSSTELAGLQVGQLVQNTEASMEFAAHPAPVYITAIDTGAGEITVSSAWTGATSTAPLLIGDSIRIDHGGNMYLFPAAYNALLAFFIMNGGSDPISGAIYTTVPGLHALGIGTIEEQTNTTTNATGVRTLVIEALSTETSFYLSATHGDEYNPRVPQWAAEPAEGLIEPELRPNELGWSKTEQPEHHMLGSRQAIGNSAPILRILRTRDALWVLKGKGDGIYRVSGFGASTGFRVDPFDPHTYLLRPGLAVVLDDVIFEWTNKGLCSVTDAGVRELGGPIASLTRTYETSTDHEDDDEADACAVANPKKGQVIFCLGTVTQNLRFVYCTRTGALTKWFTSEGTPWIREQTISAAALNQSTRGLWFGLSDSGQPRIERLEGSAVEHADSSYAIDITTNTVSADGRTAVVEIASESGFEPEEGALILRGAGAGIVIAVQNDWLFTVACNSAFGAAGTGAGTAYDPFDCMLTWRPKTAGAPGVLKRFMQAISHWQAWWGVYRFKVRLQRDRLEGDEITYDLTRAQFTRATSELGRTMDHRAMVGRAAQLATRLTPRMRIKQAGAKWAIGGLSIDFEPLSTRVAR